MFGRWSSQPWDKGNLRYESFPLADEASIPTEEQELQQELEDVAPLAGSSKPKSHWASLLPMWSDADTKPTEASGKRSLVYILAACGALAALFLIRLAFVPAVTDNKLLVLYAYHETVDARRNAEFFIRHGLHAKADFIFVLNGETDLDEAIPVVKNIRFIKRENTCYDLGAHGEVLSANDRALVKKYNKFILMNASIRGPFLPHWSSMCWSDAFANKVTETNKLVGMTMNCLGGSRPHLQSMILATDKIGLEVLLVPEGLSSCHSDYQQAVATEIRATSLIWDANYSVDAMMEAFQSEKDYGHTCTHGDILFPNAYYGGNVSPYETIFAKPKRGIDPITLSNLDAWTTASGYSSYDRCL